jgi:hypothetical protein
MTYHYFVSAVIYLGNSGRIKTGLLSIEKNRNRDFIYFSFMSLLFNETFRYVQYSTVIEGHVVVGWYYLAIVKTLKLLHNVHAETVVTTSYVVVVENINYDKKKYCY